MTADNIVCATILHRALRPPALKSSSTSATCGCGWTELVGTISVSRFEHQLYLARFYAAQHLFARHGARWLDQEVSAGIETLRGVDERMLSRAEKERVSEIFWTAVHRKEAFLLRPRKVALELTDRGSDQSWCADTGGGKHGYWSSLQVYLRSIRYSERTPREEASPSSEDGSLSLRQSQHLWYGSHRELNWTDRVRAESMGIDDADSYVNNWLESE